MVQVCGGGERERKARIRNRQMALEYSFIQINSKFPQHSVQPLVPSVQYSLT